MRRSDDVARIPPATSVTRRQGMAGRIGATLFFLVWLAIPTVMLVFILRDGWKNAQTWRWQATECTILRSAVERDARNDNYAFRVQYAYRAAAPYTCTVYSRGYHAGSDYTDAQRLALQYPAGARVTCYVNPSNPADAVLKRNNLGTSVIALFPTLFIAIGLGGLWFAWRGGSSS